jgi:Flp pilus assembly pilin Flp
MIDLPKGFVSDDRGAETVEYALVLRLTALAAVVGITSAGGSISAWWNGLAGTVNGPGTG